MSHPMMQRESVQPATAGADTIFAPDVQFEIWWEEMQALRRQSEPDGTDDDGSRMSIESLPGSNCEVTFEGVLHFDGHSVGNIRSPGGALIVTRRGRVDADIDVGIAIISGTVTGNITATERVLLDSDALVKGQIITRRLSVKPGALFEGECVFIDAEDAIPPPPTPDEQEEIEYLMAGV